MYIHKDPGTGSPKETGVNGNVVNCALPPGSGSKLFRKAWEETIIPKLMKFKPQFVIVSAGSFLLVCVCLCRSLSLSPMCYNQLCVCVVTVCIGFDAHGEDPLAEVCNGCILCALPLNTQYSLHLGVLIAHLYHRLSCTNSMCICFHICNYYFWYYFFSFFFF
jgi:hypothetical protein